LIFEHVNNTDFKVSTCICFVIKKKVDKKLKFGNKNFLDILIANVIAELFTIVEFP
jgi:hypothetical protein